MEQQIFIWCDWDEIDTGVHQYSKCQLVIPFDNFDIGETFDIIIMDTNKGIISLQRNNHTYEYKLSYTIGNKLHGGE